MPDTAVILFGRGSDLGNFKVFADSLAKQLSASYGDANVVELNVELRQQFFNYLHSPPFKGTSRIAELHVFSHAIGGGLFLAYHDTNRRNARLTAMDAAGVRGIRLSYSEVLINELGTVFTDDMIRAPFSGMRDEIRKNFTSTATIKIWGCNSGVSGWVYSDDPWGASGAGPINEYYFRALNEQHMPKPSIAQAFADYFARPTYGAQSGSHIEVRVGTHWVTSSEYRRTEGHWPAPRLRHRLAPDRGPFHEYTPVSP